MDTIVPDKALLWKRIHEAIDRGEDPLADPRLAEELSETPEVAAQAVRMLRGLEYLASAVPGQLANRPISLSRRAAMLATAAAILLLVLGVWSNLSRESIVSPEGEAALSIPQLAMRRGGIQFRVILEHTTATGRRRVIHTNHSLTSEFRSSPRHRWLPSDAEHAGEFELSSGDTLTYRRTSALPPNP
jgi:hypothetical protein